MHRNQLATLVKCSEFINILELYMPFWLYIWWHKYASGYTAALTHACMISWRGIQIYHHTWNFLGHAHFWLKPRPFSIIFERNYQSNQFVFDQIFCWSMLRWATSAVFEIGYMGVYPGVGPCLGHYGNSDFVQYLIKKRKEYYKQCCWSWTRSFTVNICRHGRGTGMWSNSCNIILISSLDSGCL